MTSMDAAGLLASATEQTGLDDFGDDSFREGLDRLVHSIETESKLNELGQMALPFLITRLLTTRLQVEDWYRRHPEIDEEPIEAPLIGLGLPRTGSTALSFLLAEDPGARSLLLWESNQPCPPPSTVAPPDPRIAEAAAGLAVQEEMNPRLAALVPAEATGPMECQELMALDFKAHYFSAFAHLPVVHRVAARRRPHARPTATSAGCSSCCSGASRPGGPGGSSARPTCCGSTTSPRSSPTPGS